MDKIWIGFILCLFVLLVAACGADDSMGDVVHDENNGGVLHAAGKNDPLANCSACHGADLSGGKGDSCYTCHTSADHGVPISKINHKAFSVDCNICHGPENSGGLGPACSTCHSD